jgi:hypothetical protein
MVQAMMIAGIILQFITFHPLAPSPKDMPEALAYTDFIGDLKTTLELGFQDIRY